MQASSTSATCLHGYANAGRESTHKTEMLDFGELPRPLFIAVPSCVRCKHAAQVLHACMGMQMQDVNQRTKPKCYLPETAIFKHRDIELATQLTKAWKIPKQAWAAMKANGVVLPLDYTEKATAVQTATVVNKTGMAVAVTKAKRRPKPPNRNDRMPMKTGDVQHVWVKLMLRQRGLPIRDDALLDHGKLLHNMVYATTSAPSGAMLDENYANILASEGGPDTGSMVPQTQAVVCRRERHNADAVVPTAPQWDIEAEDVDPQQQHENMLTNYEAPEAPVPDADDLKRWEAEWEKERVDTLVEATQENTSPIRCQVKPPRHTTSATISGLSVVGGLSIAMPVGMIAIICWLTMQGIQITGFWLTLTPSGWKHHRDDNAIE